MKLYVASSWRNSRQQGVVRWLREKGHDVYDFRNPKEGDNGFHWSEIDKKWKLWTPEQYMKALSHPIAEDGFRSDFDAMKWADACVLVLPCGRSAHLEAGYFAASKQLFILLEDGAGHSHSDAPCAACGDVGGCHGSMEPELMYNMANGITCTLAGIDQLLEHFKTSTTSRS